MRTEVQYGERYRSEAKSGKEVLGMDRGWVGNGCGPNRRIGHGYDTVVNWLQKKKSKYAGHKMHSRNVSTDEMLQPVLGLMTHPPIFQN